MSLSEPFNGPVLIGIQIFPEDPLKFSFILGQGEKEFTDQEIRSISEKSIRYFLAGLAIPEQELWVNLSPYESDRIVSAVLGRTEIGQDMLEQDYILKQLSASLTFPETDLGKKFWNKVYQKTQERFGNVDIPLEAFNKVWIVPEHSLVYETTDRAVIGEARLKVMLESDYLAWKENLPQEELPPEKDISNEVMREVVLPLLEEEVNNGTHFIPLRQIYHALILSSWFKDRLKMSAVAQVYGNQKKINGIEADNQTAVQEIYAAYLKAYQLGAYDYIKEDADTTSGAVIPRRYFSGGAVFNVSETQDLAMLSRAEFDRAAEPIFLQNRPVAAAARLRALAHGTGDYAMLADWQKLTPIPVDAKEPKTGRGTAVALKKIGLTPKHVPFLLQETGLDLGVELLDFLYDHSHFWNGLMDSLGKRRLRNTLRAIIADMHTDFEFFQTLSDPALEPDLKFEFGKEPIPSGMHKWVSTEFREAYEKMLALEDGEEKERERGILNSIFHNPGNTAHFFMLLGRQNEQILRNKKIGDVSLYEILAQIVINPETLPEIPGIPENLFIEIAIQQKQKFQKIYDFMIAQLKEEMKEIKDKNVREIYEAHLMVLEDARKNTVEEKIKNGKNWHQLMAEKRKDSFEQSVAEGRITDPQMIKNEREAIEGNSKAAPQKDKEMIAKHDNLVNHYVEESTFFYAVIHTPGYLALLKDTTGDSHIIDPDRYIQDYRLKIEKDAEEMSEEKTGFFDLYPHLDIRKYGENNPEEVRQYTLSHLADLARYSEEKRRSADEALWIRSTAASYVEHMRRLLQNMVEKLQPGYNKAAREYAQNPNTDTLKAKTNAGRFLSATTEAHEMCVTMFREVILLWHWHTNQLRSIVIKETASEVDRATAKVNEYLATWEKYGQHTSTQTPELQRIAGISHLYVQTIGEMLASFKRGLESGAKDTTHSYRYFILEDAIEWTLQHVFIQNPERYRPLLQAIGKKIIFAAEISFPNVDQYEKVDLIVDYLLTPTDYRALRAHFGTKLRNIITTAGTIASHYALLASLDKVGIVVIDKNDMPARIPESLPVYIEKSESRFFLRFDGQRPDAPQQTKDKAMLTVDDTLDADIAEFFNDDPGPSISANADTPHEVEQALGFHASGTRLARSENLLNDFDLPTRAFFRDAWREMALKNRDKIVRIRALDWKIDKKSLMLAHVTYDGKRLYLDEPIGREILKEQLRAILDLKSEGIDNIEFMFPMVEGPSEAAEGQEEKKLNDNEQIAQIIGQILTEEDFRSFLIKPAEGEKDLPDPMDAELYLTQAEIAQLLKNQSLNPERYQRFVDRFPVALGIMIETEQGLKNLPLFQRLKWIKFFSIGSNDLISEVYHILREAKESNTYFEDVYPQIVRYILNVAYAALKSGKEVCICGELASKQRFWFIREMLPKRIRQNIHLSMPSTSIPNYNIVQAIITPKTPESSEQHTPAKIKQSAEWLRVMKLLRKILKAAGNADVDAEFKEDFKQALLDLSTKVDAQKSGLVAERKKSAETPITGTQTSDGAMLAGTIGGDVTTLRDSYGGVDFTNYRDSIILDQSNPTATVPLPNGQTITIGGPDFAGFTFEIIQIVPYTVSPGM